MQTSKFGTFHIAANVAFILAAYSGHLIAKGAKAFWRFC